MYIEEEIEKINKKIDAIMSKLGICEAEMGCTFSRAGTRVFYKKTNNSNNIKEKVQPINKHDMKTLEFGNKDVPMDSLKHRNEWLTIKNEEKEKTFSYNGHMINIFTLGEEEFANIDTGKNIKLIGGNESFDQINNMKKEVEEKWMIRKQSSG